MLNFSQETIYSILCAVLPCAIYYIIRKIKGQKNINFTNNHLCSLYLASV